MTSALGHSPPIAPPACPAKVRYAAESGSELSYRKAAGPVRCLKPFPLMTLSSPRPCDGQRVGTGVTPCRTYIGKLEAEGVIQRQGDGFPLDQSRVVYLRYLRRERRQTPRGEADADHVRAKTEMLQLRLMEKRRELVRRDEVDAMIDQIAGTVLTHLSGMAARCSRDMAVRRKIDAVVYEVRKEMAKVVLEMADKSGEPPLEQQAAD